MDIRGKGNNSPNSYPFNSLAFPFMEEGERVWHTAIGQSVKDSPGSEGKPHYEIPRGSDICVPTAILRV